MKTMDNLSKYINIYNIHNRYTRCGQVDEVLKRWKMNTCHMYKPKCLGVISAWGDDNYRASSCVPCGRIINKMRVFFI